MSTKFVRISVEERWGAVDYDGADASCKPESTANFHSQLMQLNRLA